MKRQSANYCENVEAELYEDGAQVVNLDQFRGDQEDNADGRKPENRRGCDNTVCKYQI